MTQELRNDPADRSWIDISDEWQRRWWCNHFGCTNEELLAAIRAVGVKSDHVLKYVERADARTPPISLTEEFAFQHDRCRKLLVEYRRQHGSPIAMYRAWKLEQTLQKAASAAITGSFIDMHNAYKSMEECAWPALGEECI